MVTQSAIETAKAITEDHHGADYYYNPDVLAPYLKSCLGISDSSARELAQHIREDRDGADHYADEQVLAQLLDGNKQRV